jgi:hypothetical protein
MHEQSLDHSYSKRETSLTTLKTSQSVIMILVVRLGQLTDTKDEFSYKSVGALINKKHLIS